MDLTHPRSDDLIMTNRRDPEHWKTLQERKLQRDTEFLAGQIGPETYCKSLMNYGYLRKEAEVEMNLLPRQIGMPHDSNKRVIKAHAVLASVKP